ncbi:MAG TPA: protein kinase [Candidatus Angelobacter sp.]|nr:protein kinase [Candidatus Angelobacter sp.]
MAESQSLLGQTVSHYHILKKLGEGGMGEVYLAQDTALDRTVALKFVLPEMKGGETARKRLLAEARSAAALDHPFICKVYEAGEVDGRPFIAMEYVEGQTLNDKLMQGTPPLKETLRIAVEIAEALGTAHSRGIIHRDLKPPNIMLTLDGHAKVMDFGLAKHLPPGSIDKAMTVATTLTDASGAPGTLLFMSPEQLKGEPADARSDIFAFGLILYQMIAGVHPFLKDSPIKTACAILDEEPHPIVRPGENLPDVLLHTMKRMLAKDRNQRFQSIREVHTNLKELLQQPLPQASAPMQLLRMSRPLWLTGVILAIIFGFAGASYWVFENYFHSPRAALAFQKRDWIVIADFENLTGDKVFDRSLQTALNVGIQQSQYVNVFPPARIQQALARMRKEGGTKLDEALASELAVRESVKAVLVCSIADIGGVYSITARLVEPNSRATVLTQVTHATGKSQVLPALDSLAKTVRYKLGESLLSISRQDTPLPRATTASLEALKTYADGKKLAATNYPAAIDLIQQAVKLDPDFAMAHADLGLHYYLEGDKAQGEEHFAKALSLLDRLTMREKLWIRAAAEDSRGNRDQAVSEYGAYLAQYPDDGGAWFRLGWTYMATLHQYEKAIDAFQRVLQIDSSQSGAYINLATCYGGMAQNEKALEYYQKAFQLNPAELTGPFVNHEYGFMLVKTGNLSKAAETFQKMISEELNWKKARGYRSLGMLDMYQGKYSEAIANFKEAILFNKATKSSQSEYRDHLFLASAYRTKGRNMDFASELAVANGIATQARFGPTWSLSLAKAYARLGKSAEAAKLLREMESQAQNPTAISGINSSNRSDQAAIYIVQGEIALAAHDVSKAMESFELADKVDPGANSLESLAFGYRTLGKPRESALEYEKLIALNWLGGEGQNDWTLAHYELGKLYGELGDPQKAKESYEKLLSIWKDADPDIPVLVSAKAEYAKLQ